MKCLDLTLATPAENLACDEALLDWCEEENGAETLRFWEPREYFVVVGYANKAAVEVNLAACDTNGNPVLRRCSGGGTVLQGPGCLNYSLILRFAEHPTSSEEQPTRKTPDILRAHNPETCAPFACAGFEVQGASAALQSIPVANRFIMERNRAALESLLPGAGIAVLGHTDLAIAGRKFSGNAQRRRKRTLLFHGTFLLNFDLALMGELLPLPSQQPAYRQNRAHAEFLANLSLSVDSVKRALQQAWQADELLENFPRERADQLARDKYATREWNLKF